MWWSFEGGVGVVAKGDGYSLCESGQRFFDQKLLRFLEEMGLSYIVVARLGRQDEAQVVRDR